MEKALPCDVLLKLFCMSQCKKRWLQTLSEIQQCNPFASLSTRLSGWCDQQWLVLQSLFFPKGTICWCYLPPFCSETGVMEESNSVKNRKPAQICCAPGEGEAPARADDWILLWKLLPSLILDLASELQHMVLLPVAARCDQFRAVSVKAFPAENAIHP